MQLRASKGSLKWEEARELGGGGATTTVRRSLVLDGGVQVLLLYIYRTCGFTVMRSGHTSALLWSTSADCRARKRAHTQSCARTELLVHNPPESAKRLGPVCRISSWFPICQNQYWSQYHTSKGTGRTEPIGPLWSGQNPAAAFVVSSGPNSWGPMKNQSCRVEAQTFTTAALEPDRTLLEPQFFRGSFIKTRRIQYLPFKQKI